MKTNLLVTGLLVSLLAACGGGSSPSSAATAQASSLSFNLDDIVAIGTGEIPAKLTSNSSTGGVIGLTSDAKIVDNMLTVDDPNFVVEKILVSGDFLLVNAGFTSIESNDALLPNGKLLSKDCAGQIRINTKSGTMDCLVKNLDDITIGGTVSTLITQYAFVDKKGTLFAGARLRVDSEGNVTKILPDSVVGTDSGITDEGTYVVTINGLTRIYPLEGEAKTIDETSNYILIVGSYIILSNNKVFNSKGEELELSGMEKAKKFSVYYKYKTQIDEKIFFLADNGELITIDLEAKAVSTSQLANNGKRIFAPAFVSNGLYYASIDGVKKATFGTTNLTAADTLTESVVEGLDANMLIFGLTAVSGDQVIFSGETANLKYVTGQISGVTATQVETDLKVSGIQAL